MEKDSLIIVSGGMDSITMLYEYQQRIAIGVSFDYGSNHNQKEIPLAKVVYWKVMTLFPKGIMRKRT